MDIDTIAVCLVILPLAFVDVSVRVPELACSVGFVIAPLAFVFSTIWPDLNSGPMSHSVLKISYISKISHSNLASSECDYDQLK